MTLHCFRNVIKSLCHIELQYKSYDIIIYSHYVLHFHIRSNTNIEENVFYYRFYPTKKKTKWLSLNL